MSSWELPNERAWEKLFQVAVHGAVYDSRERLPHSKCLNGTRLRLLNHIYRFLDKPEKNQLIWLHGTAGVGKSAVAFTVAERMRDLKASEETTVEKRLAGTFFFSRTTTNRCTTAYVFATLAYQLAKNFPSVRSDVCKAIIENPAVLDPTSSLRDQMESLFLRPLRKLCHRLRGCPPLSFVIDALDECTSEAELAELISLLGKALRESDLPKLHILLTSRSEAYVREAMEKATEEATEEEEVHPLVCEIPVKNSGDGVPDIISLDGADVDNDIYVFLNYSFTKLRRRYPNFPQPKRDQLVQLATRAGRRFIVASTMMKFIDDEHNDPRVRLQIMLNLTSQLLPGAEVYKLYDSILSTCADPNRAFLHLSVVAALADPLPASQISKLLGHPQGKDVEATLVQLRSVMDIPTDSSLPVNIYHSSVRDYVSNPSNCSLPNVQYIPPHSLLAYSSLSLMIHDIPTSTALLDGLVELKKHSEAIPSKDPRLPPHSIPAYSSSPFIIHNVPANTALLDRLVELKKHSEAIPFKDPRNFMQSLEFVVQPPEPLQVLSSLLWLRGDQAPVLRCWLETPDGRAWLKTYGHDWLDTQVNGDYGPDENGERWLRTVGGHGWLETEDGERWLRRHGHVFLRTEGGKHWLQTEAGQDWLQTKDGEKWTEDDPPGDRDWMDTDDGQKWLRTQAGQSWLQTDDGEIWMFDGRWLPTQAGRDWLQTLAGKSWLQTTSAKESWLLSTREGGDWLQTQNGGDWLRTQSEGDWMLEERGGVWGPVLYDSEEGAWLQTQGGRTWLLTQSVQHWLQTSRGRCWLRAQHELDWLLPEGGRASLEVEGGSEWLDSQVGKNWLETESGRDWLGIEGGKDWLKSRVGKAWLQTEDGQEWVRTAGIEWLCSEMETQAGQDWLKTREGEGWLQMQAGKDWLKTRAGKYWLQTQAGQDWLKTMAGEDWLRISIDWLKTQDGQDWLQTQSAQDWMETWDGENWLQTQAGQNWLKTWAGQNWLRDMAGKNWLQTQAGQNWLQTRGGLKTWAGRIWLQTQAGQNWLQTQTVQDRLQISTAWLKTQDGQDWLQTQAGQDWLQTWFEKGWLGHGHQSGLVHTQTEHGWDLLDTQAGQDWLQTKAGKDWLQTQSGQRWLQDTTSGRDLLGTQVGKDWLESQAGKDWLRSNDGSWWVGSEAGNVWLGQQGGQDWLQTQSGRDWLQTWSGQIWLRTQGGEEWLQRRSGRDWLQTHGEAWPFMGVWMAIVEFCGALEAVSQYPIVPELPSHLPAFEVILHLKSLPDFLTFPVFLALRGHHDNSTLASQQDHFPDVEIIHVMKAFVNVANKSRERSQSASNALKYACQHWTIHLARVPRPWDTKLGHTFYSFWNRNLLYWLEMQWCLKGLRACLAVLHEGEKLVGECPAHIRLEYQTR